MGIFMGLSSVTLCVIGVCGLLLLILIFYMKYHLDYLIFSANVHLFDRVRGRTMNDEVIQVVHRWRAVFSLV